MCNCGCAALGGFASSHAIQASSVGSVGAFSGLVVGTAFCFTTATLRVRCHLSFPEDGTTVYGTTWMVQLYMPGQPSLWASSTI